MKFGARWFKGNPNDPNDGFAVYNFAVTGVTPSAEFQKMRKELEANYGPGTRLSVISPDAVHPTLKPLTDGIYRNIKCQAQGVNLYTDMACSFVIDEAFEPDMSQFFQTDVGWAGEIDFAVRTKKTTFEWKITPNWHRIHEHFKAQVSVRYWFVSGNISYETQRLIQEEHLKIDISGGTPSQKEMIYTFAERIAQRLFQPTLQPSPMPDHFSGAVVCLSVNYQKIEENKVSIWEGREQDYEIKPLGIAALVGNVPADYFSGYEGNQLAWNLDDPGEMFRYVAPGGKR